MSAPVAAPQSFDASLWMYALVMLPTVRSGRHVDYFVRLASKYGATVPEIAEAAQMAPSCVTSILKKVDGT